MLYFSSLGVSCASRIARCRTAFKPTTRLLRTGSTRNNRKLQLGVNYGGVYVTLRYLHLQEIIEWKLGVKIFEIEFAAEFSYDFNMLEFLAQRHV